MYQKESEQLL